MKSLPMTQPIVAGGASAADCWNQIGVWGDRSCPELAQAVHCQNCPVFSGAGRRFLNAPSPAGYVDEWTERLADPTVEEGADLTSVLVFRVQDEWLALPVQILIEVTTERPSHRVPHRHGALAGLVNIRGELHLCIRLSQVLGLQQSDTQQGSLGEKGRLLVVEYQGQRWVFPVDEVDQVHRLPRASLVVLPPTVGRAVSRMTSGVFRIQGRAIGLLDEKRLFPNLGTRLR